VNRSHASDRHFRIATIAGTAILVVCVAAGLFARFYELGERQLAVDEYYFLVAVDGILEHGVPAFPTAGYYTRGLPLQYITAGSILLFGDSGFAQRLPVAIFGLASVLLLFVYTRPQLGRRLAVVLAVLLLVSSWEVEFSRFARMYSAFQCATLAFLIAYDRALLGERWDRRYLAHAAVVVMVLTHHLGLLMLPLLFVPLLVAAGSWRFPTKWHAIRYALVSAGTAVACKAYTNINFRSGGIYDRFPIDYVPVVSSVLRLPEFPFWNVRGDPVASVAVLIAALAISAALPAAITFCRGGRNWAAAGLTGLLLSSAALHCLVVSAACGLMLWFRHEVQRDGKFSMRYRAAFAFAALMATSWFARALVNREWVSQSGDGMASLAGAVRRAFFGWPDFYTTSAVPWAAALPGIGLLIALAVTHQIWTNRKQPLVILARNPALLIAMVATAFGVLDTTFYAGMRFSFFIYPVMLYTVALSALQLTERFLPKFAARADLIAGCSCLVLFAASSDFSPRHLIGVAGPEASFRIGAFEDRGEIWYPRYDYASAAEFLEARSIDNPQMPIITVGLPPVSHYLDLDHAVFYPRGRPIFHAVTRDRGTRDLWSQRRLLGTDEDLRSYTAGAEAVWLIRFAKPGLQRFRAEEVWSERILDVRRDFLSEDGRIEAVTVTLRPVAESR